MELISYVVIGAEVRGRKGFRKKMLLKNGTGVCVEKGGEGMIVKNKTKVQIRTIAILLETEHFKAWYSDGKYRISSKEDRYTQTKKIEELDEIIELINAIKEGRLEE